MKKFDETYEEIMEMLAGDGGAFGDTGDHGGDLHSSDWYAPGDARIPDIIGSKTVKSNKKRKKKNSGKKRSKNVKVETDTETTEVIPLQRRIFPNM